VTLDVLQGRIDVVGFEGAAHATFFPSGTEHEMLHDELAATGEKIRERFRAVWSFKDILLFDFDPGQFAALPVYFIALACELLPIPSATQLWTFFAARFHDEISPLLRVLGIPLGW
jgi:hypothetical protein